MDELSLTVEQKFTKAMLDLRLLHPFYSSLYEVVEKEETTHPHVETVAVTPKKILYHKENLQALPYSQLLFVLLQAVSSLALKHGTRQGNRDPQLWGIASTLYVNKLLATEFGLDAPGHSTLHKKVLISMPPNALYNENINLEEDSVETVYDRLKAVDNPQEFGSISGQGTSGETSPDTQSPEEEAQQSPSGDSGEEESFGEQISQDSQVEPPETIQFIDTFEEQLTKERDADALLKNASTKATLLQTAQGVGTEPCLLQRLTQKKDGSSVDWKKLLRHHLQVSHGGDLSYERPDPRFFSLDLILPSVSPQDPTELGGVKVCIDTSGSVSDERLGYFYQQVESLCQEFHVTAELLFWDADIQGIFPLETRKDLEKVTAVGGGGTDPSCLFRYFESKDCRVKPLVTLIFTDGYVASGFHTSTGKRKYKNTLWIMTEKYNSQFKPPFGKIVCPHFPNQLDS